MGFERLLAGRNSSKTILYLATPTQFVKLIHLQKVTCHVVSLSICLLFFETIHFCIIVNIINIFC